MQKTYYDPADLRKFGKITEWSKDLGEKFFEYYGKVFEEGALTAREKSLNRTCRCSHRTMSILYRRLHQRWLATWRN